MTDFYYPVLGDEVSLPLFVLGAGARDREWHFIREDGYPGYQIIYCTRGAGVLKIADGEFPVKAGDAMYLPPNVPHEYYPVEDIWETHWIAFSGRDAQYTLEHIKLDKAKVVHISDLSGVEAIFKKILYLLKTNYYYAGHECSMHLYQFLIELHRVTNMQNGGHDSTKLNQLKPVINYIDTNFYKELTLVELADLIDLSPQYLCRLFKECLNLRPFEYLARKRIQQAKIFLLEDKLNINEIATKVGYNDCSYFCAVFKKHEMLSPAEFRSLHKKAGK
ncbi:MAG: AraC family ligand binding domain-containing protein [Ruminococcus sp.]|jgi:AraC-like DNA-binding protein|uniref:AraC family transcriptional regulator n=1 Tax=Ruminococcus albus SY3 TaxID=1341156 RepID=A0A011VU28_RUMAL|nr:AraC family ligand binding domain-containing protein [Ruminococcus albus]EXM38771.1 AraC family transcriptional regulator [Ruminococcus albus SY3]MBE6867869.1 helix-turn-helix domain-containing protein [Ruminococcus albus]MBP5267975.1 AraC family ligand binding domain-containing protein [Ruminococcus sp.]MBQ1536582.1 AraC family ligand binding domain-containing protein [Ruminococcus sp.]